MTSIEPVIRIDEVQRILSVSAATIYRWLAESRRGVGTFPLPVNTGGRKRRLLFTRASILAFLENQNSGTSQPPLNFVSEAEHRKRNDAARQSLKAMGVKLNDPTK